MLSKKQYQFLKWISDRPHKFEDIVEFLCLDEAMANVFIRETGIYLNRNGRLILINETGKAALSEYRRIRITEIRYWITTIIAVAAFILSIISLKLQLPIK